MEIWLRDQHVEMGVPCERVPLSGSMGGKYSADLAIPNVEHSEFRCESKARRNGAGFAVIEKWLGKNDILFLKRNHQPPLVVLPFEVYKKFIKAYHDRQSV